METRDDELVNLKVFTNSENLRWSLNPSTIFLRNTFTESPAKKNPYCNPTFISSTNIHFLYKDMIPLKRSVFIVGYQTHQHAYQPLKLFTIPTDTSTANMGKYLISAWQTCFFTYQLPLLFLTGYTQFRSPFSWTYSELIKDEVNRHFLIVLPHTWDSLMALQLIYA